jgi:hypothetical protein
MVGKLLKFTNYLPVIQFVITPILVLIWNAFHTFLLILGHVHDLLPLAASFWSHNAVPDLLKKGTKAPFEHRFTDLTYC